MSREFNNFIVFKATIPYEFKFENNNLLFTTNVKLDDAMEEKIRRFTFHKETEFVENQRIPSTNSFFSKMEYPKMLYSYNISNIVIQVEIFKDEIQPIKEYFDDRENCINKLSPIFQNLLLLFARIYNETMNGIEFFKPIVDYYGPSVCVLYLEEKPNDSSRCIVTNTYSLKKIKLNNQPMDITEIKPIQWREYINRAINSFNLCDYLDTILFSSISIETYVVELIKKSKYRQEYYLLKEEKEKNGRSVSFFQEVDFLTKNKIIKKVEADSLKRVFGELKNYRNSIVHGDVENPFFSKKTAMECIEKVIDFYNQFVCF